MERRYTNKVTIGSRAIGYGEPIAVQSMLSVPWENVEENIHQAVELEKAGCDILRIAIPTKESVSLITKLKEHIHIPLVADIHFDWRLAIAAAEAGIDKIRINPGNIGDAERIRKVADICNKKSIPIRIGVNSGSVEKNILAKYGSATPEAMVESALYHASLLERFDFSNIVLSMKSPNVSHTIEAFQILAKKCEYPLHLGITHTGIEELGKIKSSIGIGSLLAMGIGDTFRVSLTAPPVEEIKLGKQILASLGYHNGPNIISCPTCGRCTTDIFDLTKKVERALKNITLPITVAIMGCVVNGPGEAKEADLGITGGNNGKCVLFYKGRILRTVPEEQILNELLKEIEVLKKQ